MRLLPLAVLAYLLIALAWPTWRTWRRARVFPVVFHREAETAQRVIGLLLGLLLAGLAVWSLLCAVMEPGRLGIWQLGPGWQALGWGSSLAGSSSPWWRRPRWGLPGGWGSTTGRRSW